MRKSLVSALATLGLCVAVAACGGTSSSSGSSAAPASSSSSGGSGKAGFVPVRIGFSSWIGYGAFHVAQAKGFFKAQGVPVQITVTDDTPQRLVALKAGRLDATSTTVDTFASAAARGLDLVQVAGVDQSDGADGIVASKSVTTIRDLKGKSVAVNQGTIEEFLLAYILKQNGMSLQDVTENNLTPDDAGAAFAAGKVPVAVTYQPWLSKAEANPNGHVLASTKDYPALIADTVAFSKDFVKQHPQEVVAFLKAYEQGVAYIRSNPRDALAIMAKAAKQTPQALAVELRDIKFLDTAESLRDMNGTFQSLFTSAGQFWKDAGQTPTVAPAAPAFDSTFLKQVGG